MVPQFILGVCKRYGERELMSEFVRRLDGLMMHQFIRVGEVTSWRLSLWRGGGSLCCLRLFGCGGPLYASAYKGDGGPLGVSAADRDGARHICILVSAG